MLNDALYRLNLVNRSWLGSLLPTKEVADKDWAFLFINNLCPILELIIVALTGSQLQFCDCLWVPGVLDTILAPCKESLVLQEALLFGSLMQGDSIACNLLQTNTSDGAHLCTEVAAQQVFAQTDALENLGSTI